MVTNYNIFLKTEFYAMKRALRILIPLALIIAVVACAAWYLLVYDRDFTRDMLLTGARQCEASGHHQLAAWLYDLAYQHASHDDDVAIELARQYIKAGNYTKAEYTLYQAISDGGSAKLYAERCRVFVLQDKLLDAVNMLDSISDPTIRAELEQTRPMTPSTNYEPGFYNQYITVELTAPSGTIYATTDGTYPSVTGSPCTQPITLSAGETTIYAITVDDNGLVSPLAIFNYTIGGIIEPVTFNDPAFERELRAMLDIQDRPTVYTDELWDIQEFTVPSDAASYADLANLPYLTKLTVENGLSDQLHYIGGIQTLQDLTIIATAVSETDLAAIAALPDLTRLTLIDCSLSSISSLAGAENLEYLNLNYNSLRNLSPLAGCQNLQVLKLSNNAITDLSALSGLTLLQELDVSHNSLSVIDPICGIPTLEKLDASHNKLVGLGSIGDLALLKELYCQNNNIGSIAGVEKCTQLEKLNIADNEIVDILSLSSLTRLTYLDFANNQIPELPAFSKDLPLVTIDGSYNLILSLEPLAGLQQLNNVLMDHNPEIESVEPLKDCPRLIQVNVYGTQVTEVAFLTEQGVIVNFDPTLEND